MPRRNKKKFGSSKKVSAVKNETKESKEESRLARVMSDETQTSELVAVFEKENLQTYLDSSDANEVINFFFVTISLSLSNTTRTSGQSNSLRDSRSRTNSGIDPEQTPCPICSQEKKRHS